MSDSPFAPSPSPGHRLIFRWPERTASFVLPSVFLASVAAHALTFYVLQVSYPPTVSVAPPPAQVTLLTETPQNEALLRWLDAQDPADGGVPDVTPRGLGDVRYLPSYATVRTLPKMGERPPEVTAFPPALDPLDLLAPPSTRQELPHTTVHTSLSFSEALTSRDATPDQPLGLKAQATTSLQPSVFLVGVSDRGEVRYSFLQLSSGDRAIDEQASGLLQARNFKPLPAEAPMVWGFASFTWGAEAFAAPTPSPAAATPSP